MRLTSVFFKDCLFRAGVNLQMLCGTEWTLSLSLCLSLSPLALLHSVDCEHSAAPRTILCLCFCAGCERAASFELQRHFGICLYISGTDFLLQVCHSKVALLFVPADHPCFKQSDVADKKQMVWWDKKQRHQNAIEL